MKKLFYLCAALLSLLTSCEDSQNKKIPIAILTPVTHPSLESIEQKFKETMEAENPGKYRFVTYNAQGNKTLMRGEVEEIAQIGYPLVFTIGTLSSQMTTEVFAKKNLDTPIVFTCVNDPVGFHIVSSEESPGGHVTGVKELLNFKKELDLALKFKPDMKTLLLVYNPMEPGLAKDHQEISAILENKGIKLITVEVFQTSEFQAKVTPFMPKADALLVLKDNTVVGGLDILVKLCNKYRIPLVASDLDSPDRGAAFGYGANEADFGADGAKIALQILSSKISPGTIPVTPVSKFTFKLNKQAAVDQGIAISLLEEYHDLSTP